MALSAILVIGASLLAACGQQGTSPSASSAASASASASEAIPSPSATSAAPIASASGSDDATAQLNAAVDAILATLRDRDRDRLRGELGGQLRDRIRDQDLDRLMTCVPAGATFEVVDRQITISGDTATVTITFSVTEDGKTTEVERVWTFTRQPDGTWLLSELPACPFSQ
jgi:predicted lipid-binding transport protein (Tim44 family)